MKKHTIGSISTGTMRPEDLIPEFLYELKTLNDGRHDALIKDIESRMEQDDYYDTDDAAYDLNESLFDALNEYAMPYFYFGSHPGDGSDFGFMVDWDSINEDIYQDFILKVDDTSEVPDDFTGTVLHVNDHGNSTLFSSENGKLTEIWSIV